MGYKINTQNQFFVYIQAVNNWKLKFKNAIYNTRLKKHKSNKMCSIQMLKIIELIKET